MWFRLLELPQFVLLTSLLILVQICCEMTILQQVEFVSILMLYFYYLLILHRFPICFREVQLQAMKDVTDNNFVTAFEGECRIILNFAT